MRLNKTMIFINIPKCRDFPSNLKCRDFPSNFCHNLSILNEPTPTPKINYKNTSFLSAGLFLISEFLPFINTDGNGIIDSFKKTISNNGAIKN